MTLRSFFVGALTTLLAVTVLHARLVAGEGAGSLLVESEPAGASVYVDGRLAGETPLMLPAVAAGVHRVRVVRLGYLENSRLITVKPGEQATLRARLTDPAPQTAQAAALKIVIVEGEGAVNIIQQKTAVAPVIEVRDRNDQPVAGAVVRFAISKGRASFNGARTLSVTTNAAGRATAAGLTPTGSGALQIGTSVAFQGQTAVATIAQVNVLTAAQAASASTVAASSTGAAGGGGGLSTTTLAVVGGAVAGGTLVATKVLGNAFSHYAGPFSGLSVAQLTSTCSVQVMHTGTVGLDVKTADDGTVTGSGEVEQTRTVTQSNCGGPNQQVGSSERDGCCNPSPQVQGNTANLTFTGSHPGNAGTNWTYVFTGALNGAEITGTFTLTVTAAGSPTIVASFPVTLR